MLKFTKHEKITFPVAFIFVRFPYFIGLISSILLLKVGGLEKR